MKETVDYVLTSILLLFGTVHTILAIVNFENINENFFWFTGSGLGVIYLALLNYARILAKTFNIALLSVIGNSLFFIFRIGLTKTDIGISLPAIVSFIAIVGIFVFSILDLRKLKSSK